MKKVSYTFFLFCLVYLMGQNLTAQVIISATIPGECAPVIVDLVNNSDLTINDTAIVEWDINGDTYEDYSLLGMKFEAGYYDVKLTMWDDAVYLGEDFISFEIFPGGDNFTISSGSQACPGEQIQFNFDDDIAYYSVEWTFGDNTVPEDQHQSNWPLHTFYEPGLFDVMLVIDHYCGPDTVIRQVDVSSAAVPKVIGYLTNGPDYCPSDPVNFDVEGEYTSYQWDFGDENFSDERKPSHVYPNDMATSYIATVTATNVCGNSNTSQVTVTFTDDIEAYAGFDYYYDAQAAWPCPGTPVEFDAWGAGIYEWDFGDGSISNEQKPTNHYTEPGMYNVTLTVWNGCGNVDSWQVPIEVQLNPGDQPFANFYFQLAGKSDEQLWEDTLHVCPGLPINFIDARAVTIGYFIGIDIYKECKIGPQVAIRNTHRDLHTNLIPTACFLIKYEQADIIDSGSPVFFHGTPFLQIRTISKSPVPVGGILGGSVSEYDRKIILINKVFEVCKTEFRIFHTHLDLNAAECKTIRRIIIDGETDIIPPGFIINMYRVFLTSEISVTEFPEPFCCIG